MFTPQIQKDLGEGSLRMINGNLYVGNSSWLFRFYDPTLIFSQDIIELVEAVNKTGTRKDLDYRILNARSVDLKNESFMPAGKRKHRSIYADWLYGFPEDDDIVENLFEESWVSENEPVLNLMALYKSGKMRPVYAGGENYNASKDLGNLRKKIAKMSAVSTYVYFGDGVSIGIPGVQLSLLADNNFDLIVPLTKRDRIPAAIGWNQEMRAEVMLGLSSDVPIKSSPDGRYLCSRKSYKICWWTRDRALQEVYSVSGFNPLVEPDQDEIIDLWLTGQKDHPNLGIDALRWQGVPEDEIRNILKDAQRSAWQRIVEAQLESAEMLLSKIIESVNTEGDPPKWKYSGWESSFSRIVKTVEILTDLLQEDVDIRALLEVKDILQEVNPE